MQNWEILDLSITLRRTHGNVTITIHGENGDNKVMETSNKNKTGSFKDRYRLNLFFPMFPFDLPESIRKPHFLPSDIHTYVCVLGGDNC